jgi:hypothetical protein
MNHPVPAHWVRPHHVPTMRQAFLQHWVFGSFQADLAIDPRRYRTHGLPTGASGQVFLHDALRGDAADPLSGDLGRLLQGKAPQAHAAAQAAPHAMLIRGELDDPADLGYLRDLIGFIACLLDNGGVAALDVQSLTLRDRATYLTEVFAPDAPQVKQEVVLLRSLDPQHPGRAWLHTRGLRKFARPDLSIRNVPDDAAVNAQLVLERAADYLMAGGVFEDGREVRMGVAPPGLLPRTAGDSDDPDYNNQHTEFVWPQ